MSNREESLLLEACRRGDETALGRLVDAHYEPLYRFLWRLTSSQELAQELTQDAFVRALERLASFDGRAKFSTWLHTIAINLWRDNRRRQPKDPPLSLDELGDPAAASRPDQEALAHLERMAGKISSSAEAFGFPEIGVIAGAIELLSQVAVGRTVRERLELGTRLGAQLSALEVHIEYELAEREIQGKAEELPMSAMLPGFRAR